MARGAPRGAPRRALATGRPGGAPLASYQTRQFTVPAGGSVFADVHVRLVAVLTLTGADSCFVRLNDGPLGLCFESWQFRTGAGAEIRKLEFANPAGVPITLVIALAPAGELVDGRFALPAAIEVDIAAQTFGPLEVDLVAASAAPLATVHDFTDAIGANAATSPLGASWWRHFQGGGGASSTQTLFLPAANTAGAILRSAVIASAANATLVADTVAPIDNSDTSRRGVLVSDGASVVALPYPVALAAGVGLWATTPTGAYLGAATWDLL